MPNELPEPPIQPRRLAYIGTPAMAVPTLRALVDAGYEVPLVVTNPDRRRGRGSSLAPSPVKAAALELGLAVSHDVDDVLGCGADLGVVVAFGRLIKAHVLAALPLVNVHFSLLPRWRGAAPVERALLAGDAETGVCLMQLEETLDTGAVYARRVVPIGSEDTADELRGRLVAAGTELLVERLAASTPWEAEAQSGASTYAAKIDPDELRLDWSADAEVVHRWIRVGGVWTTFRGKRLKIHAARLGGTASGAPGELSGVSVACGTGAVTLVEVQPESKGRTAADAWRNGAQPRADEKLGS